MHVLRAMRVGRVGVAVCQAAGGLGVAGLGIRAYPAWLVASADLRQAPPAAAAKARATGHQLLAVMIHSVSRDVRSRSPHTSNIERHQQSCD
jgi:hypothetical protein